MYQTVDQNRRKQPIYELRNQPTKRDINQPIQKQENIQSISKSIRTLFLPLYSLEPSAGALIHPFGSKAKKKGLKPINLFSCKGMYLLMIQS